MIDPKHIEFFNELKELLIKHRVTIAHSNEYIIFTFPGSRLNPYYQTASPLYVRGFTDTFISIELVTTERVFK